MRGPRVPAAFGRALAAAAALTLLGWLVAGGAVGERNQRGHLIVSLDGGLSPLTLPRSRPAPIAVELEGGLSRDDGKPLPRVSKFELGLPAQGVLTTRGLPVCPRRLLQNALPAEALAACGSALVGRGTISAQVVLPNQKPFLTRARVLAFNARRHGGRALLLHAFTANPPAVVVLPFAIERRSGRFATVLVARLAPNLGPWPRFAHFAIRLSRRFAYRGRSRSYLSASCPIPLRNTAGFVSLAKATYQLSGGRQISVAITRSCRAHRESGH